MTSTLNFFKNLGKVKSAQLGDGLVNLAAAIDADGVGEAAIKQKQEEHVLLVQQLVEAQGVFKKEKKEFDELYELYTKKLAAAERASADFTADPTNVAAGNAAAELLASVEKLAPKLSKEKTEFESAERWMTEIQQAADEAAQELLGLRQRIDEIKQQTKEAELSKDRANKQLAQAEQLAGLRTASNKFDVAMSALEKQQARIADEASVATIAAEQLRTPASTLSDAASKYMSDMEPVAETESLADKLARLSALAK
jgi:chromosome segregation ATPase